MEELASLLLVKRDARRPWRPYKRKPLLTSTTDSSTILSSTINPSTNNYYSTTINRLESNEMFTDLNNKATFTKNFTQTNSDQRTTASSFDRFVKSFESGVSGGTENRLIAPDQTSSNRFVPGQTGSTNDLGRASTLLVSSPTVGGLPLDESNDLWWGGVLWDEVGGGGETVAGNLSWNATLDRNITDRDTGEEDGSGEVVAMVVTALLLGLIILATVIGNVFVIAAILLERHLQSVANYLILSLAVADLLVACLVMPLGAVYQVSQEWTLGPELCDMWTSSDVLCCTASILHLVAIALDRYWAVTNIDYIHQRTGKRIGLMILVIWCVSFLVCIAPLLGWKDPGWEYRVSQERMCLVSQDIGYQIFATLASFYLPLLVILFLYWRIFQTARKRIRRRVTVAAPPTGAGGAGPHPSGKGHGPQAPGGVIAGLCAAGAAGGSGGIAAAVVGVIGRPLPTISEATTTTTTTTAFTNVSSANTSPEKGSYGNGLEADPPTCDPISSIGGPPGAGYHPPKRKQPKETAETKRERKAAKTLAIITGAFVVCWLPFFVMAVLLPGDSGLFHQYVIAFFLWLGYFNSTLNPVIYTVFSPEFRHAFKRLLCGRRASVRRRAAHHHFAR